jgi:hypothetical protein
MAHASSAGGVATQGLDGPLEGALALGRVAARRARVLLDVVGRFSTPTAQRVRLVRALTKRRCSLCLNKNIP